MPYCPIRVSFLSLKSYIFMNEPEHEKQISWIHNEDSDQPGHPSSLNRILTVPL